MAGFLVFFKIHCVQISCHLWLQNLNDLIVGMHGYQIESTLWI